MVSGDNLTINNGATVTMTQNNSVLIGNIIINYGEFFIDGLNISSGNVISWVEEWNHNVTVNGAGIYRITGDWYDLGTTDGTDAQTFSLSTYYGGNFEDVVCGIWVETGRRIDFDNVSGTTPLVDDWVYKVSDKTIMGRIVSVESTYLVVKFLTGTLVDNDNLEVVKVVENSNGPDYEVTWTADVNNASGDIKESGVYQEFGNAVFNGTSYLNNFGNKLDGFAFAHIPESTTLTMGHSTNGGFVPPTGCNVRIPNVNCTSSNLTNFPGGTIYNDGTTTNSNRPDTVTSAAGEIRHNKVNLGNVYYDDINPYAWEAYYVASNTKYAYDEVATKPILENCICTSDCYNGYAGAYDYFGLTNVLSGANIKDCLIISTSTRYTGFRVEGAVGVDITGNIMVQGGSTITSGIRHIHLNDCSDVLIDNNVSYPSDISTVGCTGVYLTSCSDVAVTNHKAGSRPKGVNGQGEMPHINLTRCSDIVIKGIEILDGAICGDNLIFMTGVNRCNMRCLGMIDRKSSVNNADFEWIVTAAGYNKDINIARMWLNNNNAATTGVFNSSNTVKDGAVLNCSSGYTTAFQPEQWDNVLFKGLHAGSGTPGSSGGIEESYFACYGWAIHDGFRSNTVGYIVALMIPDTTATNSSITITAGNPTFMRDGTLDMVSGDVVEIAQSYFAKGHISFPGTYTSTRGGSVWNANEWTNVTVDFQYDIGSGWSGTWLNARTASNWTGITIVAATGVKLKFRLTATGAENTMTMFIVDTVTSIATQKANLYPIDQVSCDVILNGIIIDSRWWIYDSDTDTELAEGTALADPVTQNVVVPDETNLLIRVRKSSGGTKYKPLITTAVTNETEINVAIIQQVDEIAT